MKISRNYLKIFALLFAFSLVFGVISNSLVSYANVSDLMIGTGSNALMTLDLDDDSGISLFNSFINIDNTISYDDAYLYVHLVENESGMEIGEYYPLDDDGMFDYMVGPSMTLLRYGVALGRGSLPSSGTYTMQVDFSSTFSLDYEYGYLWAYRTVNNAETLYSDHSVSLQQSSGDFYLESVVNIGSVTRLLAIVDLSENLTYGYHVGGKFDVNFALSSASPDFTTPGTGMADSDYQSDVSGGLSDLSSSVDTMTDEISGVTEAIQNLQGAMEPHYNNVLTQLHHITEQLHAFYDQVYNNIHLPELNMLTQIKEAIENIDLQIEVDISEVKTAINNMSTAVQNKLQSTTDQITNGYDNSGIVQENEKLEQSINDYDEVESEIFDEAGSFVGEFEYPSIESLSGSVIKALAFVGSFLQSIFLCMGDFSSIITFSLTMIFVMVVVGYHRIRS